jgi:Domain of unknown function (DUF4396)
VEGVRDVPSTSVMTLSWCTLGIAGASALVILNDLFVRGFRLKMRVMEWVWPVTALYFGPFAVWAYWRFGRVTSPRWLAGRPSDEPPGKPRWATTAIGVSHCGAGCTLGDIIAEFAVFGLGLELMGRALLPEYIGDYVLAIALGLAFQYFAIAPMRGLGFRKGIIAAAKADILSLTAFEVGLFAWMAVSAFVLYPKPHPLHPDSPVYWALMQAGMILGFLTAYPINAWLIRRGIKEAM